MGAASALGVAGAGEGEAAVVVDAGGAALVEEGIELDDGIAALSVVRPSTTGCCWPAASSTALHAQAARSSAESRRERFMFF